MQKRSWTNFAASSQPLLLTLGAALNVETAEPVRLAEAAAPASARAEDFRLFEHDGAVYANHALVHFGAHRGSAVAPDRLPVTMGLSRLEAHPARLIFLGEPRVDRTVGRVEKNWAMFSAGGEVRLLYSFQPYRLHTARRWPDLQFTATTDRALDLPVPEDGQAFRNSINPVPYDAKHLLHVVHKVYPTKHYVFWAVLIDRATLLPAAMTARPLLRAGANADASILYACSALVGDGAVTLFGGIDDCAIGVWRIPLTDLERQWVLLA